MSDLARIHSFIYYSVTSLIPSLYINLSGFYNYYLFFLPIFVSYKKN